MSDDPFEFKSPPPKRVTISTYRADAMSDDWNAREIAIQALKFVKVNTKRGFLTDISVAMILVEMERSGIKFLRPCHKPSEG